ncbi:MULTISPECIES: TRAP transporter large permease [unclassified Chelatococcus]|uniref:TRAP transporter large permease n=1 Tax=unclassified Chelatococcus TaxID=2638111 RepID=UPI001BCDEDD3|nr:MULTISPECIES: TRAP transporter large permease [unclassified Chelatococcus]MBS7697458.1 TRAP transporter large permease [Chelatococcus sp. YT9]MBX3560022.1 TRAP transporter large permease [Chelatococcus sp.]
MGIVLPLSIVVLVALSLPIAAVLGASALIIGSSSTLSLMPALGDVAWSASSEFLLIAIPLFILLGEIVLRSGLATRMYHGLAAWVSWLPGGLMHSNVAACAMFAATAGSSIATAATVGTVALPEARRYRYNERLFLGTIAAGGTLGILIPPSVTLIIYAVLTNTSVPQLYLAGIVPGLALATLFMTCVAVVCLFRPSYGGERQPISWAERVRRLPDLLPPIFLFGLVVGSIYAGFASPTEAAALGVAGAILLGMAFGNLTVRTLFEAIDASIKTSSMIMLIVIAAYFLNFAMSTAGVISAIETVIGDFSLSPMMLLFAVVVLFLLLGCIMESLSLTVMIVPIVAPLMFAAGFDQVWFGILVVVLIELGMITPPIGLNLFVVQNLRGKGPFMDVITGSLPFVVIMLLFILLLIVFPGMALWLPSLFY